MKCALFPAIELQTNHHQLVLYNRTTAHSRHTTDIYNLGHIIIYKTPSTQNTFTGNINFISFDLFSRGSFSLIYSLFGIEINLCSFYYCCYCCWLAGWLPGWLLLPLLLLYTWKGRTNTHSCEMSVGNRRTDHIYSTYIAIQWANEH